MEALQQARKLYCKHHYRHASISAKEKAQAESEIKRFIGIALKEIPCKKLFVNNFILDVLLKALGRLKNDGTDVMQVARAFTSLEVYFLHLVQQPWKPEFKELKMYGGFYRTRIKSVLPDCEVIFQKAGYVLSSDACVMRYTGSMDKNFLLLLAFDCKIGFVECCTITERYNKGKSLGMNLSDAVSSVLNDEYCRCQAFVNYSQSTNLNSGGDNFTKSKTDSKLIDPPPALPKRAPIINGSGPYNMQNMKNESAFLESSPMDKTLGLDARLKDTLTLNSRSPQYITDPNLPASGKGLLTSGNAPDGLAYIDAPAEEILPEFPQGTSDDHMRASLRLVNQQSTQVQDVFRADAVSKNGLPHWDDWKWLQEKDQDLRTGNPYHAKLPHQHNVIAQSASNPPYYENASVTRKGRIVMTHNDISIDEGIERDMSPRSRLSYNKPMPSIQVSSDLGYRTYCPSEATLGPSASDGTFGSQTIYHPPDSSADMTISTQAPVDMSSRQGTGPPPVPDRALKPPYSTRSPKDGDVPDGLKLTVQNPSHIQTQGGIIMSKPSRPPTGLPALPPMSSTEPTLRRDWLTACKSNSLKYAGSRDPTLLQQSRAARSMDTALMKWECKSCTSINMASDMICSVCTHSRHGPDFYQPKYGETKKACPTCTLENDATKTHCEVCGAKLRDHFTVV